MTYLDVVLDVEAGQAKRNDAQRVSNQFGTDIFQASLSVKERSWLELFDTVQLDEVPSGLNTQRFFFGDTDSLSQPFSPLLSVRGSSRRKETSTKEMARVMLLFIMPA
jgi:hypothetical protein